MSAFILLNNSIPSSNVPAKHVFPVNTIRAKMQVYECAELMVHSIVETSMTELYSTVCPTKYYDDCSWNNAVSYKYHPEANMTVYSQTYRYHTLYVFISKDTDNASPLYVDLLVQYFPHITVRTDDIEREFDILSTDVVDKIMDRIDAHEDHCLRLFADYPTPTDCGVLSLEFP